MRPRLRIAALATTSALSALAACSTARWPASAALDPRYVAVHNALAAMGLAQVGPLHEGSLAQGQEARVTLDLPAGCSTIVAVAGEGARDVDVSLLDPKGKPLAHDTTNEPQAVVRTCIDAADAYVLVVKMASGAGPWVAATWAGGVGAGAPAASASAAATVLPAGTCESPVPLAAGTASGSTRHGESANAGSCDHSDAREIVYQLDVPRRQRVVLDLDAKFDSVLYLRKDECGDESAEVECNDDAPNGGRNRSRIERVLDPGKYFVFVDGYNNETGAYKLTLTTSDVVALDDACRRARTLVAGTPVSDSTEGYADDATASCGGGAAGADTPWRIDVQARSRVRVVEHADGMSPVVHLRRACEDPDSETACGEGAPATNDAAVAGVLDPGRYVVFADARDADAAGAYTLSYETAPVDGSGTAGDGCGDAVPLAGTGGSVLGDTFQARDDVAGSCGGQGAADVVYRVDLTRRSRFHAYLPTEEAPHRLALWRRCGDRGAEIACGPAIDDVLAPGTYFLGVDGATPDALGRFSLFWTAQDLAPQAAACSNAPALLAGRTVTGTTAGGGDRFATTCEGWDGSGTAPDRVYRFTLAARGKVHFEVDAAFDAYLVLRRSCGDVSGAGASVQLACRGSLSGAHKATLVTTLEAGTYWLVVDGQGPGDEGAFTLRYTVSGAR